jgi:sorbitol/mannitol transport system permease protein
MPAALPAGILDHVRRTAEKPRALLRPPDPQELAGTEDIMATIQTRSTARIMMAPAVILLFVWMIVPLGMTIYFSFLRYSLLNPVVSFAGFNNYYYFITNPAFSIAILNTILLVGGVLLISVIGGIFLALLLDQPIFGQGIIRLLVIAPFFVMPTVSALIWKNMLMNPVYGIFAWLCRLVGIQPFDFFTVIPLMSVIIIVAWQWLPFATLILLTALQSLDKEQQEAAEMDGAGPVSRFFYLTLPHMARAITVVILIETIFLLGVFAEILVTTNGGPGLESTNLSYLVYAQALLQYDVGGASAGGIIAVILANIVAFFLIRIIGKNLET